MFKTISTFIVAGATVFSLMACSDSDNKENAPEKVTVSAETLAFDAAGGTQSFTVTTTGEWDAVCSDKWVKLAKSGSLTTNGTVDVTVEANSDHAARTATITLISGAARGHVAVEQAGKPVTPPDPTIKVPDGYELVWNDEFDGNSLNTADWTYEVQNAGWVNNELQNYVAGAINGQPVTEVADGILSIRCFKQNGKIYSGRIYANVSKGWKYGIFEARIKLPKGKGTWPAFWMMPANNDWGTTPWPKCGEIDIMEEVGYNPDYTSSSIHCESYNHTKGTQKTAERLTKGAEEDYHVYRLEWTEKGIYTYVDDVALLTFLNDGKGNINTWPFNKPFYLILNLAWGGSWGGAQGVDESVLPATMEVDYVRVFQKK